MKMLQLTLAVLISLSLVTTARCQDASPEEQLQAWGKDFVGTLVNEQSLDADRAGVGKQGDKLVGEVTFRASDGVFTGTWTGTLNGEKTMHASSVIGWDPERKKVRAEWFSNVGTNLTVYYTKVGKKWRTQAINRDAEGVKITSNAVITIDGNAHVHDIKKRMLGDQSLPSKQERWTKK